MPEINERRIIRDIRRGLGKERYQALLGDDRGVIYDDPVNRKGYVRVRYVTAAGFSLPPVVRSDTSGMQMLPGAPCWVGYDYDGELVLLGPDNARQIAAGFNPLLNNAADENLFGWLNADKIVQLVSHPTSPVSLSVMVRSLVYIVDRTAHSFLSTKVDLTSYVPTAGNQCLAGLFLRDDDTIEVVASTAQTMDDPLDLTDIQECVTGSSQNSTPVWAWLLHDSQTTITDKTVNFGLRDVISIAGARTAPIAAPGGRLTLTSGTPLTTSNVTAAATLYYTPFTSDRIGLYSGTQWVPVQFSELSLSLAALNANTLYDIFAYLSSGAAALEALAWTAPTNGTITGATNATPIVVTYTGTDPTNDNLVTIAGVGGNTAANGTFRIANINVGAKTFELNTLAGAAVAGSGAFTTNGTWQRVTEVGTRATGLTTQNGVDVKSGDATRRYLGTIKINTTAGQMDDTITRRHLWNRYNQNLRALLKADATNHTYNSATVRGWNNDLGARMEFVIGRGLNAQLMMITSQVLAAAAGNAPYVSLVTDGITGVGNFAVENRNAQYIKGGMPTVQVLGAGSHFTQISEAEAAAAGGTFNFAQLEGFIMQ
jgi:hypothetical protein